MEMEYVYVPGTGLRVSRVCIGAMMFGKKILSQDEADRCVDVALDAGINFFDTADQYSDGVSEQMSVSEVEALANGNGSGRVQR